MNSPRDTTTYPVGLSLTGREVLVVGGGPVASRRVKGLLAERATVHVVAPEADESIRRAAERGDLTWSARGVRATDIDSAWLVFAHTSSPDTQNFVAEEAERRKRFCVKGGDTAGSAHVGAVARWNGVTVGVNASRDPRRAATAAAHIQGALETGKIPTRAVRTSAPQPEAQAPGTVALVGGGPGDTGLLTVRGRFLLSGADVVVADRLGPRQVLAQLPETTHIIEVGKQPGHHPVTQDEINRILVREAQKGQRVVRLKGGDPFVFGRGGEEVEYCAEHGIATEVVPGVTSAVSVPAAAGIPLTHRGIASGFSVLTGHQNIHHLPSGSDHTLVILMGVGTLATLVQSLLSTGRRADTPVAIVERGWTDRQRTTIGQLGNIHHIAAKVGVESPAVTVIGDVVKLSPAYPGHTGANPEVDASARTLTSNIFASSGLDRKDPSA
ncbi:MULTISPECIES: uroporphyrinogen-III C-methyltransferase [Kocuria]|uniref:uroporphyrinogen-III C-methyltransferase n=1 Tax=Kocuria TaxID=57493 RepID=UPI00069F4D52|nr:MULTISPECIES: uroporphyrinogen-III C-methyltransferase [Kocuria]RUQ22517.1 uroporphyrinogen-III C-methyltransferase [Kocuria sp. HSID16901]